MTTTFKRRNFLFLFFSINLFFFNLIITIILFAIEEIVDSSPFYPFLDHLFTTVKEVDQTRNDEENRGIIFSVL